MNQIEVDQFVNSIHAIKDDGYKGNLFIKNETKLIIKISRTKKVFYGLNGNIIDSIINFNKEKEIHFGVVLLINEQEGWFYFENLIMEKIQKKEWRKAQDGDYKINPPLNDLCYFNSCKGFEELFAAAEERARGVGAFKRVSEAKMAAGLSL